MFLTNCLFFWVKGGFPHFYSQIIPLVILYLHETRVKNVDFAYKDMSKHSVLKLIWSFVNKAHVQLPESIQRE